MGEEKQRIDSSTRYCTTIFAKEFQTPSVHSPLSVSIDTNRITSYDKIKEIIIITNDKKLLIRTRENMQYVIRYGRKCIGCQ